MHTRTITAVALVAAAVVGLAGCDPNDAGASKGAGPGSTRSAGAVEAVPSLVGRGLQAAQDAAQAVGFQHLTSHDSSGRGRMQLLDRDWKVCSQKPAAGARTGTGTKIDLGAVKLGEHCPAHDQTPPPTAGAAMPDFVGKGLNVATRALPADTSVTSTDAAGHRLILIQSDWKVCTQSPKAGAALSGKHVTFTAVKFDQTCP